MRFQSILALLLAGSLVACGSPDGPVITESDRAAAAKQHPQLLAEFGGAYDGQQAAYLRQLGKRVAAAADLGGQCTFTLVNSDVVNAFAVPGCYIYVTRGLMGLVNSEAELGAVLAHEVGHIVGRHGQLQQQRSLWRSLGVLAVQVLTGSERLTRIAGAAAGLFTLRYSRKQEFEADDLGLTFLRDAGLDPHEAADMLETLGRHERYMAQTRGRDEARSIPEWARTHPLTGERVERAEAAARATGLADDALPEHQQRYFSAVDGMLYGDDPEQGFVIGRTFAHPLMRIAFTAPKGFTLTNSPQAILIDGPDGMRGEFAGGRTPAGGLEAYTSALLEQMLRGARVGSGGSQQARINGLDALITQVTVQAGAEPVLVTVAAYQAGASAYHFVILSSAGAGPPALEPLFRSLRLLSEAEASALRPRAIDTFRAAPGDTLSSIASRMAGDNRVAHLLMINGWDRPRPIAPSEPVKIVTYR